MAFIPGWRTRHDDQAGHYALQHLCQFGLGTSVAGFVKASQAGTSVAHPNSDAVTVVQPTTRPISRGGVPHAVKSTVRARVRIRTSDLVERLSASSTACSSAVSVIVVAQGIVFAELELRLSVH